MVSFKSNEARKIPRKPLFSKCARNRSTSEFSHVTKPEFTHALKETKDARRPDSSKTLDIKVQNGRCCKELPTNKNVFGAVQFKNEAETRTDFVMEKRLIGGLKPGLRLGEVLRQELSKGEDRISKTNVLPSLKSELLGGKRKPVEERDTDRRSDVAERIQPNDVSLGALTHDCEPEPTVATAQVAFSTDNAPCSPASASSSSCSSEGFHYDNYRYDKQHPTEEFPRRADGRPIRFQRMFDAMHPGNAKDTRETDDSILNVTSPLSAWKTSPFVLISKTLPVKEMSTELKGMGDALCRIYGGERAQLVWSHNTVRLPLEHVTKEGGPPGDPTLWIRGGRVYDYIGDLGTYEEFAREANPWQSNRSNRRTAGFQPFPFLPLPLGERTDDGSNTRHVEELKKWGTCGTRK